MYTLLITIKEYFMAIEKLIYNYIFISYFITHIENEEINYI